MITKKPEGFYIPAEINEWDRLTAALYYVEKLNWAVHPLFPPDKGEEKERGKKPWCKGWREHKASDITTDYLDSVFSAGSSNNIGVVVRPPFVAVDLDSKPDKGASVMAWLAEHPELGTVPRERTGGGVHLHFLCRDLPAELLHEKKAPTVQINERVTAELYLNGLNLVLAPSTHKSGHRYCWEVTGEFPEVKWVQICEWFGFETPEEKRTVGRPGKEKLWWAAFKGDLSSLDILALFRSAELLGECLDPDDEKWAVRCPWDHEHSAQSAEIGSDAVIFSGQKPAFKCLHAHCHERTLKDVCLWFENRQPGLVDKLCQVQRVFVKGSKTPEGRPKIVLPTPGTSQSEFSTTLGAVIGPRHEWFISNDRVVRLHEDSDHDKIKGVTLAEVTCSNMVTACEHFVQTGVIQRDQAGDSVFVVRSMTETDARITLEADPFKRALPRISRILDVPVPLLRDDGTLWFPQPGYDAKLRIWLNPSAPLIRPMSVDEAIHLLLDELLTPEAQNGWCWKDDQSRTHALARIITPLCRGLMGWRRTPLWIFQGNREGCGKDSLASTAFQLYINRATTGAPLSKGNDDEMRKRITTHLTAGARYIHFANLKGHIRFPSLEAATDDIGAWEDRLLGANTILSLKNEAEFSFSANNGSWEADIERRSRRISLHLVQDDGNTRKFRHTNILAWVAENRVELLSAVAALAQHWVKQGCTPGPSPFASFPEWARVVGGVMHAAGLPDPCERHKDQLSVTGDQGTEAMRKLCRLAHVEFGERWVTRKELYGLLEQNGEIFTWLDFSTRAGLTQLGCLLARNDRREFGGILFNLMNTSKNYTSYQFQTMTSPAPISLNNQGAGTSGTSGTSAPSLFARGNYLILNSEKENNYFAATENGGRKVPEVPDLGGRAPSRATSAVADRIRFAEIAATISASGCVALDLETYGPRRGDGLDPWAGDIRLLSLRVEDGDPILIDLRSTGYDLGPLKPALESCIIIAHNAKFDLLWLRVKCGLLATKVFCTLVGARLLSAGTKPGNDLDKCLERHLDIPPAPDHSRSDWGSMLLAEDQFAYAARDVLHLHDLATAQRAELDRDKLDAVAALEMGLVPNIVEMEYAGIAVDREHLSSLRNKAQQESHELAVKLRELLTAPKLNPSSPQQLTKALQAHGITLSSTDEETLKAADDGSIIPVILAYRSAEKQAQQATTLLKSIKADGRIHGRFDPTGTDTGRFSSKGPNLQNIARGELRSCFIPAVGHKLIVADYSQIELRAVAAIADETKMIEAYRNGADFHKQTASVVLGKPVGEVTKEDRQLAKAVNFGLLYGQSANGLVRYAASCYGVKLELNLAEDIRRAFFRTYAGLKKWHDASWTRAKSGVDEVRTISGRRRLIPKEDSEWNRFAALVSTPVQGGCADGMKSAIVRVHHELPIQARLISTVHDEVIVEAPEHLAAEVCEQVSTVMREAMEKLFPAVPIEVEAHVCATWGEK